MLFAIAVGWAQSNPPESGMSAFGKMVPMGFVNRDVTIPAFSDGKRSSLVTAETLTRIDEEHLNAEKVVVEIYADQPAENIRVELKSAVYDMPDQILRSGERSKVSRMDFEMEGDTMVFDARTSVGSMKGRVRTLIFDTTVLSGTSGKNQPIQN